MWNVSKALEMDHQGQSHSSSSSSEADVPPPKKIKFESSWTADARGQVPISLKREANWNVSKALEMDHQGQSHSSSSSSEADVPPPKKIKFESSWTADARGQVPISLKREANWNVSKALEMDHQGQSHSSSSSSEADVPPPKKIKFESSWTADARGQVPISLKRESSSHGEDRFSSDPEHSSRATKIRSKNGPEFSAMKWTEKIKHRFPGIEKQSIKVHLPEEQSTKYALLLVPKHLDPRNLLNLKCSLNKNTLVHLNEKEYIFEQLPKKPDPVLVNLDTQPRLVKLQSVISLQQFVPELKLKELVAPKRENISLPSEIKARHPLFGANYKEKIRLNKNVKKKLQEAFDHKQKLEEKEKRRRRKSTKKSYKQSVEETIMDIFNSASLTTNINDIDLIPSASELNSSNSKRKNRHQQEESEDNAKHKHKSKKKDKEASASGTMDISHKKSKRKSKDLFENSLENDFDKRKHK